MMSRWPQLQRSLQRASFCLFAALLLAVPTAVLGHGDGGNGNGPAAVPSGRTAPIAAGSTAAQELTMALLAMRGRPETIDRPGMGMGQLLEVARQRQVELSALMHVDPAEVLRVAIPGDVRASLPAQAAPFLELESEEMGELEVLHVDHVDSGDDHYLHFLHTAKGKVSLHFANAPAELVSGMKARAQGVKIGDALALRGEDLIVTQAALSGTLGAQKTLVILVNFSNAPTQPYTTAQAQSIVFGTTSSYDYEVSYQQTTLTGAVAGWFTIAETSTTCNYGNIATQAKQKASAAGYALSNYNRLVYVFPANSCGWWGMGTIGGNPSQAWIHTKSGFSLRVVGHEMGHNFGLYHAHSLDCGTAVIAASGCTSSDYGDPFDLMGGSSAHFNAFQKERLGWLDSGVSPPITTVAAQAGTVTYSIAPLENARDATPRALKIPRGTACSSGSEWFYVEARQAKGFDSFLAGNTNVTGGVLIHKVTGSNGDSSYLLDMTPATSSWSDAALVAGLSFTDPQSGVSIAPVSVGSGGATVNVTFPSGSCTRSAPKVALTPTGTVWTASGSAVSYAVSVTNQDGCGCGSTPFDVSAVVPGGWSSTNARTASIAPGGSASAALTVTTSAASPVAFYSVTMKAANASAPTMTASTTGTVAIAAALTVGVSSDKSAYAFPTKGKAAVNAAITTQVYSGGTATSGASVVTEIRNPAGALTTLSGTTDASGRSVVNYAMKARTSVKGVYTITSRVTMGSIGGTATSSFVLN